jgi:hypothetical protein
MLLLNTELECSNFTLPDASVVTSLTSPIESLMAEVTPATEMLPVLAPPSVSPPAAVILSSSPLDIAIFAVAALELELELPA